MSSPLPEPSPAATRRGAHCSSCGARYGPVSGWPRTCPSCGDVAYRNPLPVAVALVPVVADLEDAPCVALAESGTAGTAGAGRADRGATGLVVITRTIEPAYGTLALPGGFIDHREDWRHAVVRELAEETGIEASYEEVALADVLSSPDGHLLLFGLLPPRPASALPPSAPTAETDGWSLLRSPATLGFPLHTTAAQKWFAGGYADRTP
ncbi:NUDIX domain-containing protein [Streptomyces monticola]|uniref:NUDIX domain-containing protein n=1 Tax=Streptomyces monticola TaxID=2666263 RepID=A0ABW2JQ76_9ACTN